MQENSNKHYSIKVTMRHIILSPNVIYYITLSDTLIVIALQQLRYTIVSTTPLWRFMFKTKQKKKHSFVCADFIISPGMYSLPTIMLPPFSVKGPLPGLITAPLGVVGNLRQSFLSISSSNG